MKQLYILLAALFVVNGAMAQWVPQNSGTTQSLKSIYFTDANNGFVGGHDTFLKTTNGGSTWNAIPIGGSFVFYSIDFPSTDTGYAVGYGLNGYIYKTTDAGTTWTPYTGYLEGELYSVYFTDNNTGYTAGNWYTTVNPAVCDINKTTDGGTTWNVIAGPLPDFHLYSLFFTDSDKGYAVGSQTYVGQIILKTNDGGTTWDTIQIGGAGHSLSSVFFTNVDTGYVVGDFGTILKTTDGGTTWTEMWSGKDWNFRSVFFAQADTGYIVGNDYPLNDNIILKTVNGGTTWTEQPSGTNVFLESVFFTSADTGYIVGGEGTILNTTNGGYVGINDQHQTANTLTIYPNPVSNTITIKTPSKGNFSILNISAQQLLQQTITEPSTTIDVSTLQSGIYIVKLIAENGVRVGKFVKQ
jgi:photosystem II stability/assembly factor-like uncharacterized protein